MKGARVEGRNGEREEMRKGRYRRKKGMKGGRVEGK